MLGRKEFASRRRIGVFAERRRGVEIEVQDEGVRTIDDRHLAARDQGAELLAVDDDAENRNRHRSASAVLQLGKFVKMIRPDRAAGAPVDLAKLLWSRQSTTFRPSPDGPAADGRLQPRAELSRGKTVLFEVLTQVVQSASPVRIDRPPETSWEPFRSLRQYAL